MSKLKEAVEFLARRCDYATTEDGQGFNRFDTDFGHYLARTPEKKWSPKARRGAWKMVRKYRGQLAEGGIDFDSIPEPPDPEEVPTRTDKPFTNRESNPKQVRIEEGEFHIEFPYDPELVAAVKKKVDGRKWNGQAKRWEAPATTLSAHTLLEFADEYGFFMTDEARETAEQMAAPAREFGVRHIDVLNDRDLFRIIFPFDNHVKEDLKSMVPAANWNGDFWTAPFAEAQALVKFANKHGFRFTEMADEYVEIGRMERRELREASEASEGEPLPVEDRLGGTLRPFQRAGVRYALRSKRAIIADEMGLGKTVQALAALEAEESYPAIVVVPSSVKSNWAREARKWLPEGRTVEVLSGTDARYVQADVVILNYAILNASEDLAEDQDPDTFPSATQVGKGLDRKWIRFPWVDILKAGLQPQAVVLDESHYVKNSKANRSRAARALAQDVPVRLALTGTPVLSRPSELIHQLQILDQFETVAGSWKRFVERYCDAHHNGYGWNIQGSSNLDELNDRLRATCMVRRQKQDVLQDLPAKQRAVIPVDIDNRESYDEAHRDLIEWLRENVGADAAARASRAEQIARISHLKRLAARGKISAVVRWVQDFLESGEKLVLFAHHREVQNALYERFQGQAVRIRGGDSSEARQTAVDEFQENPDVRLMVGSLKAAGVGITLTSASNVAFVELGWTPADHDQAEDRVHRIGQDDSVTAWYLLAEDTIDEEIGALIDAKRQVVDQVVDGGEADDVNVLDDLVTALTGSN